MLTNETNETNKDRYVYKHSPHGWAWEVFDKHEALHWLPEEVPMADDIRNFQKQPDDFLKQAMLFFVQADVEVGNTYIDTYLPNYSDLARQSMLLSFANRESIHVKGYAHLVDTLALGDDTYSAFLDDPALLALHRAFALWRERSMSGSEEDRFGGMCANTLMGEGVMLFGLFAMLLNYQRFNKYNGMCTIVAWSIRDEDMHVYGITKLMKTDERFRELSDSTKRRIYKEVYDLFMPLIKQFVKNCFAMAKPEGITEQEVCQFVEFQAQRRSRQANVQDDEISVKNPFPWFDQIIGGVEHSNFFERRATEYSKGNLNGEYAY